MNRLESKLFDLEELLIRNDGMADDGTYSTIVGIANDVSELESQNAKLRELLAELASTTVLCQNGECNNCQFGNPTGFGCTWDNYMRELGIEV